VCGGNEAKLSRVLCAWKRRVEEQLGELLSGGEVVAAVEKDHLSSTYASTAVARPAPRPGSPRINLTYGAAVLATLKLRAPSHTAQPPLPGPS
jgi:hypothetical protein